MESCTKYARGGPWLQLVAPEQAGWSAEKLREARHFYEEIGSAAFMVIDRGAVAVAWGNITTLTDAILSAKAS